MEQKDGVCFEIVSPYCKFQFNVHLYAYHLATPGISQEVCVHHLKKASTGLNMGNAIFTLLTISESV